MWPFSLVGSPLENERELQRNKLKLSATSFEGNPTGGHFPLGGQGLGGAKSPRKGVGQDHPAYTLAPSSRRRQRIGCANRKWRLAKRGSLAQGEDPAPRGFLPLGAFPPLMTFSVIDWTSLGLFHWWTGPGFTCPRHCLFQAWPEPGFACPKHCLSSRRLKSL